MSDLTPITREEMLLDGEDLEPITRKEMFIKRIYDKTQVVPEPITREEMFLKKAGEGGSDVDVEQLSVNQNGIYSESGKAYSPVIVEVPQITTESLSVTDNGTYTAPSGKAYNEVNVNLPLDDKTITSNGTYKASDDSLKGYDEVVVDVPLPENAYLLKEIEDVEIASFNDGSDLPMPKLEVAIEPQQDLHGYDSPWVGGSGKNKANPDLLLNGYTNPSNRKYDDTTMAKTQFVKTEGLSTITISATNGNRCYVCYYNDIPNVGDEASTNVTQVATSLPQTITVDSSYTYVAIQVSYSPSGANVSNVQVESGNQATTFAPYSNICPISGWSAVDVNVSGVNIWDEEWEVGGLVSGCLNSKNFIPVIPSTTYFFAVLSNKYPDIYWYDENKTLISFTPAVYNHTFDTPSNCHFIKFRMANAYGATYNNDISINYPSTDTSYHAYNPNSETITIQLGDTYYGGKLDVVSGVLTVDRAYVDLGTLNWTYYANHFNGAFGTTLDDLLQNTADSICSIYESVSGSLGTYDKAIYTKNNGNQIYVRDTSYGTDASAFKTAMNGVQLVYELDTPTTIQLSPTQVSSLMGVNNIWADCGDIIDGQYFSKEV